MWTLESITDYIPKDAKKKLVKNMLKLINWEVINNRIDGK